MSSTSLESTPGTATVLGVPAGCRFLVPPALEEDGSGLRMVFFSAGVGGTDLARAGGCLDTMGAGGLYTTGFGCLGITGAGTGPYIISYKQNFENPNPAEILESHSNST